MYTTSTRLFGPRLLLGSSLVLLGLGGLTQAAPAARRGVPDTAVSQCTDRNVAGSYGFSGSGTVLTNTLGLPEGLLTTVGILTFDGQGRWETTNQSLTLHGQEPVLVSLTGTYAVRPDCTFTLVDDITRNEDAGVFVQKRHEGFFMGLGKGVFLTFTMKRIDK
jgi:hypothetical protein